jgi:cell division protein FtsB
VRVAKYRFDLVVMAACLALLGYFAWHGFKGPRNFDHRDQLLAKAEKLDGVLQEIRTERLALDKRVALMRPESIDPDMLDELARNVLNFAKPTDLIVSIKR